MSHSADVDFEPFSVKKACDQCRKRKIRCDKISPCSPCVTAGYACTVGAVRHREAKSRIFATSEYERKMDVMNDRLKSIEDTLYTLSVASSSLSAPASAGPGSDVDVNSTAWSKPAAGNDMEPNGENVLRMQTLQASEFLERAVSQGRVRERNPSVHIALMNLRELVQGQKRWPTSLDQRFPLQRPVPQGGLQNLPLPPYTVVMALLREVRDAEPTMFIYNSALVGITDLSKLAESVYISPQTCTHAELTVINAGLYSLFAEQASGATNPALRDEYSSFAQLCQANLETLIKHFPLFPPAKIINIQALLLSVSYSVNVCWPSVAWQLNALAVQLCQDAGFHRAECINHDPENYRIKSNLFWQAFILDKCLSLRLRCASVVEDWDITIPKKLDLPAWDQFENADVPRMWLITSPLRARAYEQLYSREAMSASPVELLTRAKEGASECAMLEKEMSQLCAESSNQYSPSSEPPDLIKMCILSSTVQFYVTTTFIYRAIPAAEGSPSQFCNECLESARNAIKCHLNGIGTIGHSSYLKGGYISWTLMLTPFAPFFILFCHVIETLDVNDLSLLKAFTDSLETFREASATAQKLFSLCRSMCDVACAYQEDVWQGDRQGDQQVGSLINEYDEYLGQMGLEGQGSAMNLGDGLAPPETTDWFFGGRIVFQ